MSTTPKLDRAIQLYGPSVTSDALAEIREHLQRMPTTPDEESEVEDLKAQVYSLEEQLKNAREVVEFERKRNTQATSYPSEAETRLIELCEHCVRCMLGFQDANHVRERLAAIKRDLGLPPSP